MFSTLLRPFLGAANQRQRITDNITLSLSVDSESRTVHGSPQSIHHHDLPVDPKPPQVADSQPSVRRRSRPLWQRWYRWMVVWSLRKALTSMRSGRANYAFSILKGLFIVAPHIIVVRLWLARMAIDLRQSDLVDAALSPEKLDRLAGITFHSCRVAQLHILREDYASAKAYLLKALERYPDSVYPRELLITLNTKDEKGDLETALAYCRQVLAMPRSKKQRLKCLSLVVDAYANAGRTDVEPLYHEVLTLDPFNGNAYHGLIQLAKTDDLSDPLFVTSREALARPELALKSRQHFHFAVSRVYDTREDYAASFAHLALGNQVSSHLGNRASDAVLERMADDRCRVFTKGFIDSLRPAGSQDQALVCIVGMPRSGTTLLHQILSQCPEAYGAGERTDFSNLIMAFSAIINNKKPYPDCCLQMRGDTVSRLAAEIQGRLKRIAGSRSCVITKLPDDHRELGLISILFPNVRIIHARRSPADTCLSCFRSDFANINYAHDLDSLACAYRQYQKLITHWSQVLPASSLHEINYEELVDNPEQMVRQLCEFAGLTFTERCLEFHKFGKSVRTVSRWQVRQPIYTTSVNRSSPYHEFLGPILGLQSPSIKCAPSQS